MISKANLGSAVEKLIGAVSCEGCPIRSNCKSCFDEMTAEETTIAFNNNWVDANKACHDRLYKWALLPEELTNLFLKHQI